MLPAWNALERIYGGEVRGVANRYGISDTASPDELPRLLEEATSDRLHSSTAWFVSGISGSGKSTIIQILEQAGYERLPNVVTRERRSEESQQDNLFVDDEQIARMDQEGSLFDLHTTNGKSHAILRSNIEKLLRGDGRFYLDKSPLSASRLLNAYPALGNSSFVYLFAPSFEILSERIAGRENSANRQNKLSDPDIRLRFEEEIVQMNISADLPYVYLLNDSIDRVSALVRPYL